MRRIIRCLQADQCLLALTSYRGPGNRNGKIITADQLQVITSSADEMRDHFGLIADKEKAHFEFWRSSKR